MLEPREADIPALFLFLVVLPLVTYVLLGKWNEAAKKKARISMLALLAAEEALRVEAMAKADAISPGQSLMKNATMSQCARCGAAAATRCSRCKSVRYCSGKCQIIHWRQGHKQECQQRGDNLHKCISEALISDNIKEGKISGPLGSNGPLSTGEYSLISSAEGNLDALSTRSDGGTRTPRKVQFGKVNFIPDGSLFPEITGKGESDDCNEKSAIKFVKPPYTLEPSKKLRENSDFLGAQRKHEELKSISVKKSPKITKRGDEFKKTKMLFPYEELVKFFQCEVSEVSPRGLLNCGNSCYANAVLQCLTSTKPLLIYLLRRMHSRTCAMRDWCLMCELEVHVSMLRESGGPLSASGILSNMRNIGCRIGGGTQEDAHEFLRLLVTSMQSICLEGLGGEKEVDLGLQDSTLIQQIFGGRIRSKVKCLRCHLESERYENIMDLTLEIHGWVESLEDALTQFTAPEDLDGENMYRCGSCSAYVKARKQLSLHEVPNILTIVLKRFQTGKYGKINKYVTFPDLLDMIPFMTGTGDSPPLYILYAVIVHLDTCNASFSGHYISYIKDLHGSWFKLDDSDVQPVPFSQVMSEGAYMLFYTRSFPRPPSCNTVPPPTRGSDWAAAEFSDATSSSDWSLFTSSDESSFTTESVSDSFSVIDQLEPPGLDPVASIFGPFYSGATSNGGAGGLTHARMVVAGRPQTRFFRETRGLVFESDGGGDLVNCSMSVRCGGGGAKRHRLVGSG